MNNENKKEITLPSGTKVEIVDYVEAGVVMDLEKAPNPTEFILKALVLSLAGSKEDLFARIRKLNLKDYRALDAELVKLIKIEEIPKA